MINFLEETLDMLKDCGKTEDDVLQVGRCEDWASDYPDVKNTWEWFKSKANFEYDNEYDGSEWWEYKRMPTEPLETKDFGLQRANIYD